MIHIRCKVAKNRYAILIDKQNKLLIKKLNFKIMSEFDELFDDSALDDKMSFLDDKKGNKTDYSEGLYKVDMSKVKDKKRGYRAELRFLPNFTKDPELVKKYLGDRWTEDSTIAAGDLAIEKATHFVKTNQLPELRGSYDSPKNFGDECLLSKTYYELDGSNNAVMKEKAKMLDYSKYWFSYVLVMKDEQQPELEGKVMVFKYSKQVKEIIKAEEEGEITGEPCNVFKLNVGKDFRLIVKEKDTGDFTYPDYKMSSFKESPSSISLRTSDGEWKNVPLEDGDKIPSKFRSKIMEVILDRDKELEAFGPKRLTEEQQRKVTEIVNYLTGKASANASANTSNNASEPTVDDFSFDEEEEGEEATAGGDDFDEDDFDF